MYGEMNAPIAPEMQLANIIKLVISTLLFVPYQAALYLAGQFKINPLVSAASVLPIITHANPSNINNLNPRPIQTIIQFIEIPNFNE
jgi:hypothetical protein